MEQKTFKTLILEEEEHVFRITLNRPPMNATSTEMYNELHSILDMVESSPTCRVLIFTGAGRAFCVGADISELVRITATLKGAQARVRLASRFAERLRNLKQPTIMAVNGDAVGGGFSLAMIGDLIVASETARFGASFLRVGLIPDLGGIHTLVHLIGTHKTCELTFMANIIDAETAEKIGLVNRVVKPDELHTLANEWADKMARMSFVTLGLLKKSIYKAQEISFQSEVEDEINVQSLCLLSPDGREGLSAFLEKRPPVFNADS